MSSRVYILLCRRWWSCREGNRLYFDPDQRLWKDLLLSCCHGMASAWCLLQWGGPWASQAPLVTHLLLWHCLLPNCGYPSKENEKNYIDFMVSSLPLFSCTRLAVSLISDPNCIDYTVEAKAATFIIHFWIKSPSQERILCKHSCPAWTGWDCWHPLICSIFCMHNYGS